MDGLGRAERLLLAVVLAGVPRGGLSRGKTPCYWRLLWFQLRSSESDSGACPEPLSTMPEKRNLTDQTPAFRLLLIACQLHERQGGWATEFGRGIHSPSLRLGAARSPRPAI